MIVAWNEFEGKRLSLEEAEKFFGLSAEEIKQHIEDGTSIPKGIRYWHVDELFQGDN